MLMASVCGDESVVMMVSVCDGGDGNRHGLQQRLLVGVSLVFSVCCADGEHV